MSTTPTKKKTKKIKEGGNIWSVKVGGQPIEAYEEENKTKYRHNQIKNG